MPKQHVHYEQIIDFANGYEIEVQGPGDGRWRPTEAPMWSPDWKYRRKPEKKSYAVFFLCATQLRDGVNFDTGLQENLKLTFDGETGALTDAEVIR